MFTKIVPKRICHYCCCIVTRKDDGKFRYYRATFLKTGFGYCSKNCFRSNKILCGELSHPQSEELKVKYYKYGPSFYVTIKWLELRVKVFALYGKKCCKCGSTDKLHIDHIIPKSWDSEKQLSIRNMQVLCSVCNLSKSNKNKDDFRPEHIVDSLPKPNRKRLLKFRARELEIKNLRFAKILATGVMNKYQQSNFDSLSDERKLSVIEMAKNLKHEPKKMSTNVNKPKVILRKKAVN